MGEGLWKMIRTRPTGRLYGTFENSGRTDYSFGDGGVGAGADGSVVHLRREFEKRRQAKYGGCAVPS